MITLFQNPEIFCLAISVGTTENIWKSVSKQISTNIDPTIIAVKRSLDLLGANESFSNSLKRLRNNLLRPDQPFSSLVVSLPFSNVRIRTKRNYILTYMVGEGIESSLLRRLSCSSCSTNSEKFSFEVILSATNLQQ